MNDAFAMSTSHSLQYELDQCNDRLDCFLRERFNVSLRVYKIIKAVTQLLGVAAGVYAISQGADAMTGFALIATIITGPEALEAYFSNISNGDDS